METKRKSYKYFFYYLKFCAWACFFNLDLGLNKNKLKSISSFFTGETYYVPSIMLIQFMKANLKGNEGDFNNAEQLNKYITIP